MTIDVRDDLLSGQSGALETPDSKLFLVQRKTVRRLLELWSSVDVPPSDALRAWSGMK